MSNNTPTGVATIGVSTSAAAPRSWTRIAIDAANPRRHKCGDGCHLDLTRIAATAPHRASCVNATASSKGSNPDDRPDGGVCTGCPGAAEDSPLIDGVFGASPEEVAPDTSGANVAVTGGLVERVYASG